VKGDHYKLSRQEIARHKCRDCGKNGATEFSVKAKAAHRRGQPILIEHVAPTREFTCNAIEIATKYKSDQPLVRFITIASFRRDNQVETAKPEQEMDPKRLKKAGIKMAKGLAIAGAAVQRAAPR
jgi:phosphate starvation-inducible protein PhoH